VRIALDTNRYADLANGLPEAIQFIKQVEEIALPFCEIGELRAGFIGGNRLSVNDAQLKRLLSHPRAKVIYPDRETVDQWAYIRATLLSRNLTIPHNDIWIAAICIQHGYVLYSRDKHFDSMNGLHRAK